MRVFPLLVGAAVGIVMIAAQSYAQDYPPPRSPHYGAPDSGAPNYGAPPEEVIVTPPPPYVQQRSENGAPIVNVSMSREVPFSDLDLRTRWGVRELRSRISFAATTLCRRLDAMYPATVDNSGDCYRNAMRDAWDQAHQAIGAARGYGGYDDRRYGEY